MTSPTQSPYRIILFVDRVTDGSAVLMSFRDPAPTHAVLSAEAAAGGDQLQVTVIPVATSSGTAQIAAEWLRDANEIGASQPLFVKYRGVEVMWRPGSAVLQCDTEQVESLLQALVEFAHFEAKLRCIEGEIAEGWTHLEEDQDLAFEVSAADLKRGTVMGQRMHSVLHRRIRFARIEPYLWAPGRKLAAGSQKLGEELREKAAMEARIETVDGQLEVFEHVYEMGSQRMGESRAARDTQIVEWIIIALLAGEALLMLMDVFFKHRGI